MAGRRYAVVLVAAALLVGCRDDGEDLAEARRVAEKVFESSASAKGRATLARRDGDCVAVAITSEPADGSRGVPHVVVMRKPPSGDRWEPLGVRDVDDDAEEALAPLDGDDEACGFR